MCSSLTAFVLVVPSSLLDAYAIRRISGEAVRLIFAVKQQLGHEAVSVLLLSSVLSLALKASYLSAHLSETS